MFLLLKLAVFQELNIDIQSVYYKDLTRHYYYHQRQYQNSKFVTECGKCENKADKQEEQDTSKEEKPNPVPDIQQIPHQQTPVIPDVPSDVPEVKPTPPVQDKQPETLEDRLNDLLELTCYQAQKPYKIEFLANVQNDDSKVEYKAGQQMKLNVTICLIMYNEPSFETSFLNEAESDSNAIL